MDCGGGSGAWRGEELIQRLGTVLLDNAPQEGWRRIDLVSVLGDRLALTVVMAAGTPEDVAAVTDSHTGEFLRSLVEPAAKRKRPARRRKVAAAA